MICDKCRNKCDICGEPINSPFFPKQQPWYEPNKIWCSGAKCENSPEGFLSMISKSINDSNTGR